MISLFKSLISNGVVYAFAYFRVYNNRGSYHTTSHHFRMFVQAIPTVRPSFCNAILLYSIKLVPFTKIMGYFSQHPFLVDVARVITGVEGERKYVKDGKLIDMLLNVAVLGEMVERIKDFVAAGEQQVPVVIFQFATVKTFRGLHRCHEKPPHVEEKDVTHRIEEGDDILSSLRLVAVAERGAPSSPSRLRVWGFEEREKLAEERETVCCREASQYLSILSSKLAYVAEDEVLYSIERKTIKELRAVGFYIVLATVLDVEPALIWWYKSCVCSVKAKANADTYFYDGCNKDVNHVVDMYKLDLLVFYGTATTTFVVFDKEATALFGWTCTEMVKELNEKGKAGKDPIGFKEFLFKVELKTTGWCDSYDVSLISFELTILARWRDTQGLVKSGIAPAGPTTHFDGDDFLIFEKKRSIEQLKLSKEFE
ncbi:hypothetical protein Ahy_B05g076446 [Arachis hypogaea]|uniref:Uncharacterized protein n=1 Tax=Arachis hypogaea TaxID=3818 RepID=A0A444Z367_ARAHY|nr:hypothetical protein Ahy_B05g076446 [Arachis hypogaea]